MSRRRVFAAAALLLLGATAQCAFLRRAPHPGATAADGALAVLGGLRTLAAEAIWMRADRLQQAGRFSELVQLAEWLTALEPYNVQVWEYSAWNLAYNVSSRLPGAAERWPWVYAGIRLLRDRGIPRNPRAAALYRNLAFLFEVKLGVDKAEHCAPEYRRFWREIVEDAARRGAWSELGMESGRMAAVAGKYGIADWGDPFASAIYWADAGLECGDPRETPFLNEIIRQSRSLLARPSGTPVGAAAEQGANP